MSSSMLLDRPARGKSPVPIRFVDKAGRAALVSSLDTQQAAWVEGSRFRASAGQHLVVPGANGAPAVVLVGLGKGPRKTDPFLAGKLPGVLPQGDYALGDGADKPELAALAWLLGGYAFERYRKRARVRCRLVAPGGVDAAGLRRIADGVSLTRDLVNTPANDMGPDELEAAARALARRHKARVRVTKGDALLAKNFPMIHAVGRASSRVPRLIDFSWGRAADPRVTLVGKGVCFDTGGLNLKPGNSMALMKKDMGGAANVLGLAAMIMDAGLRVRLRVLIPAVENAVSGNAFRPGDVLPSRKGLTVEIGNTDAEGRLVLADALALADEEAPELLIDMATLTGAARVALGPDLAPFYCDDDDFARALADHAATVHDPVWRMPFWDRYDDWLDSSIADVNHISEKAFAGSVTAGLFLRRFVEKAGVYVHFDIFAWTPQALPARPAGGEAQGIRALFGLLGERYAP